MLVRRTSSFYIDGEKMQAENWQAIMAGYHQRKISVIPLTANRTPFHKDWSKWNKELPEESLYKPTQRGIGCLPGSESGVMFVDIDTEDPELLAHLKNILPSSPLQRFGSKGVGIVYAYNEEIHSRKFRNIKVEVFSDSGYVVIPPSHHEKTGGTYKWLGPSLLDFPKDDLPTFPSSVLDILEQMDQAAVVPQNNKGGRHDALLNQAFAALHSNKAHDKIAQELAAYDLKHHKPSWFKEEMKAKTDADVLKAAAKFVDNVAKTVEKKNPTPNDEEVPTVDFNIKAYPPPTGFIGHINSLIEASAYTAVPNMAFGSALAIFATLIGNHYKFEGVGGNLYCLLLADSGTGKKFGLDIAKTLLSQHNRIGSADYQSNGSVSQKISDYCVSLHVSDEFSKTLKLMKNGGVWQQSIPQALCDLWSASGGQFINSVRMKDEPTAAPLITSPYVSILASTTISEFKESVNKTLFTSGLLPRCLFFIDKATKESRPRLDHEMIDSMTQRLVMAFQQWVLAHPINHINGAPEGPVTMKLDPAIASYFDAKMTQFHHETFEHLEGTAQKVMVTRKREFYKKLAILHSLSREPGSTTISKEDLDWAEEVFTTSLHNQTMFINEAAAENDLHALREKIYSLVLMNPKLTKRELTRRTQGLSRKQRDALIEDLIDAERIAEVKLPASKNGKILTVFKAIR
jgi:hypothetical protein